MIQINNITKQESVVKILLKKLESEKTFPGDYGTKNSTPMRMESSTGINSFRQLHLTVTAPDAKAKGILLQLEIDRWICINPSKVDVYFCCKRGGSTCYTTRETSFIQHCHVTGVEPEHKKAKQQNKPPTNLFCKITVPNIHIAKKLISNI